MFVTCNCGKQMQIISYEVDQTEHHYLYVCECGAAATVHWSEEGAQEQK